MLRQLELASSFFCRLVRGLSLGIAFSALALIVSQFSIISKGAQAQGQQGLQEASKNDALVELQRTVWETLFDAPWNATSHFMFEGVDLDLEPLVGEGRVFYGETVQGFPLQWEPQAIVDFSSHSLLSKPDISPETASLITQYSLGISLVVGGLNTSKGIISVYAIATTMVDPVSTAKKVAVLPIGVAMPSISSKHKSALVDVAFSNEFCPYPCPPAELAEMGDVGSDDACNQKAWDDWGNAWGQIIKKYDEKYAKALEKYLGELERCEETGDKAVMFLGWGLFGAYCIDPTPKGAAKSLWGMCTGTSALLATFNQCLDKASQAYDNDVQAISNDKELEMKAASKKRDEDLKACCHPCAIASKH